MPRSRRGFVRPFFFLATNSGQYYSRSTYSCRYSARQLCMCFRHHGPWTVDSVGSAARHELCRDGPRALWPSQRWIIICMDKMWSDPPLQQSFQQLLPYYL